MTRNIKLQYLQLLRSGEIPLVKQLPAGEYVPVPEAGAFYIFAETRLHRFYNEYTNGAITVPGDAFVHQDVEILTDKLSIIPEDMEALFASFPAWQRESFCFFSVSKYVIREKNAVSKIVESQLEKYQQEQETPAKNIFNIQVFGEDEFWDRVRAALFRHLDDATLIGHLNCEYILSPTQNSP